MACMALLLITMVSPPFVSSLAYIQLYGRRGWITYRLLGISWDPYNCWGVIWMHGIWGPSPPPYCGTWCCP